MASVYGTLSREDRVTRDHGGGAKTEEDYTYSLLNADQGSAVARVSRAIAVRSASVAVQAPSSLYPLLLPLVSLGEMVRCHMCIRV